MSDGRFVRIEELRKHRERNWAQTTLNKTPMSDAERMAVVGRLQADLAQHAPQMHCYKVLQAQASDALQILGVSWSYTDLPTKEHITKAYRFKSMRYHPDVNKTAEAHAQMKAINEARDTVENVMTSLQMWA